MKERLLVEYSFDLDEIETALIEYAQKHGEIPPGKPAMALRFDYDTKPGGRRALRGMRVVCTVPDTELEEG